MNRDLNKVSKIFLHIFFIITCIIFVIPLLSVVSISVSDNVQMLEKGFSILPRGLNLEAYKLLLKSSYSIPRAYLVTFEITVLGCIMGLAVNSLIAYPLSRKSFKLRKYITIYIAITMFFNGGLVPSYILTANYLHGKNHLWVMIVPVLCSPWYIILLRTFFSNIPNALIESAMIDGANEWRIFGQMIVPLSKPAFATVGLFMSLGYWNEWFSALLYIDKPNLFTLQYVLYKYMSNIQMMMNIQFRSLTLSGTKSPPTEELRMAMCIVAAGPMLFIFPFFQKYFVKGLTLGSIKG